jgi:hypothetical protein
LLKNPGKRGWKTFLDTIWDTFLIVKAKYHCEFKVYKPPLSIRYYIRERVLICSYRICIFAAIARTR